MKRVERLETATTPDGAVLTLHRHDGAYSMRVDGVELMSTRRHRSEDRLAELVCTPLERVIGAHVLIGGLGLGFTLSAALRILRADARVVVVEIMQEVIAWNRDRGYALGGAALEDARVELRHADVADVLRESAGGFDAIMLDVDNGAEALTTAGNETLYRRDGIAMAAAALRPSGRLAYWSASRDPAFERAMRGAGLTTSATRVRAHVTSGRWHTLLVGQRR